MGWILVPGPRLSSGRMAGSGGRRHAMRWSVRGEASDGALFGPILSTKMAGDDQPEEIGFFEALSEMTMVQIADDRLTLPGDGHEMVFSRLKDWLMRSLVWVLPLALAACQTGLGLTPQPVPSDDGFRLRELDGTPAPWPVTLRFGDAGQISGQAPCNLYFATATRAGEAIAIGQIGMTEMACMDAARMQGDAIFSKLLTGMERAVDVGTGLILYGSGHVMVFTRP